MPKNTKTHSDIANDLMHLSHKNFSTLLSSYIGSDTKDIYDKSYMDTVVISDMHDSNALRIVNTAKYLLKDQLPDPNPFTARDKAAALKQTVEDAFNIEKEEYSSKKSQNYPNQNW